MPTPTTGIRGAATTLGTGATRGWRFGTAARRLGPPTGCLPDGVGQRLEVIGGGLALAFAGRLGLGFGLKPDDRPPERHREPIRVRAAQVVRVRFDVRGERAQHCRRLGVGIRERGNRGCRTGRAGAAPRLHVPDGSPRNGRRPPPIVVSRDARLNRHALSTDSLLPASDPPRSTGTTRTIEIIKLMEPPRSGRESGVVRLYGRSRPRASDRRGPQPARCRCRLSPGRCRSPRAPDAWPIEVPVANATLTG